MMKSSTLSFLILVALLACATPCPAQDNFEKAKLAWTLPWDDDWVTAVSFVGNNRLAAGNNVGQILVWDLPTSVAEKAPLPSRHLLGHTNSVNCLLTTPDQAYLLSASNDRSIRFWDMRAEPGEAAVVTLNARAIDEAAIRKKKAPAAGRSQGAVQKSHQSIEGHKDWVLGMSLTQGRHNARFRRRQGAGHRLGPASLKELRRWQVKGWVWALAVDPEGKSALVSERLPLIFDSGRHSGLKLWDALKGEVKADLVKDFKGQMISAAAFSPDGKWLAVGRGGEIDGTNGKVTLLDPATGKKIRELTPGHLDGATRSRLPSRRQAPLFRRP